MSNYPPGVTGFERQIAGPSSENDESMLVPACERFERVNVVQVTRHGNYPAGTFKGKHARQIVRRAKGITCTFEGETEVAGILEDHTWFQWDCPSCGFENGMDVDPPEPPEYEPGDW
jgi:hypothetical protein